MPTPSSPSQGVGIAVGAQDKFSFKSLAIAAIGGGVTAGLGPKGVFGADGAFSKVGNQFATDVLRGAVGNALTQGVAVATRLQSKFDFAGVATAGIGAGVGGAVGDAAAKAGFGPVGASVIANTASGIANAATRSAINGNSFGDNLVAAIPDMISGAISDGMSGRYAVRREVTITAGGFEADYGSGTIEAGKTVNAPKSDPKIKASGTFGDIAAAAVTGSTASIAGAGGQSVVGSAAQSGGGDGYQIFNPQIGGKGSYANLITTYADNPKLWSDVSTARGAWGDEGFRNRLLEETAEDLDGRDKFIDLLAAKATNETEAAALLNQLSGYRSLAVVATEAADTGLPKNRGSANDLMSYTGGYTPGNMGAPIGVRIAVGKMIVDGLNYPLTDPVDVPVMAHNWGGGVVFQPNGRPLTYKDALTVGDALSLATVAPELAATLRGTSLAGRTASAGAKVAAAESAAPNIVYRGLTEADAIALQSGRGLTAKAPGGSWSAADHVSKLGPGTGGPAANSPWISTSKLRDVAQAYDSGHGVAMIDLNKVKSLQVEVWQNAPRVNGEAGLAYHRSIWSQEVTVYQTIPREAIIWPK